MKEGIKTGVLLGIAGLMFASLPLLVPTVWFGAAMFLLGLVAKVAIVWKNVGVMPMRPSLSYVAISALVGGTLAGAGGHFINDAYHYLYVTNIHMPAQQTALIITQAFDSVLLTAIITGVVSVLARRRKSRDMSLV